MTDKQTDLRACIVCNRADQAVHYCHIDNADYLQCGGCGLIYVDRPGSTGELYRAYSGGLFKSLRRRLIAPLRRFHHARHFAQSMARAAEIFDCARNQTATTGGKYLDVGCNKGFLLAQGIRRGWDVYGCELVPELTVPFCNTYHQYKKQVFQGRFCDVRKHFSADMFDLITAIDVIEHFEDAVDDLSAIYRVLKPGGVFVIQTPDGACDNALTLGCAWGALKPLEHLHLFNLDNLTSLARRIGFNRTRGIDRPFENADGNFVAVLYK